MRHKIILGLLVLVANMAVGGLGHASASSSSPVEIDPALLKNRASAMAPQGVPRRNIGFVSTEFSVSDSQSVEADGYTYFYEGGMFWVQRGGRFVVVTPPVGAVVNKLPVSAEKLQGRKDTIHYWFGTFFGEKDGRYEVINPPIGAVVGYIPEGYKQGEVGRATLYIYDALCFKPALVRGMLMYMVDDCKHRAELEVELESRRQAEEKAEKVREEEQQRTTSRNDIPRWVALVYVQERNFVGLRWASLPDASGYKVLRSTTGRDYKEVASVDKPQFFDEDIKARSTYYYVLQSVIGRRISADSEERSVNVP